MIAVAHVGVASRIKSCFRRREVPELALRPSPQPTSPLPPLYLRFFDGSLHWVSPCRASSCRRSARADRYRRGHVRLRAGSTSGAHGLRGMGAGVLRLGGKFLLSREIDIG